MTTFVFEQVGTHKEWKDISKKWKKPSSPTKDMGTLTDDDVAGLVCTCYPKNSDRSERDVVLFKPAGSSTPNSEKDFWASGANPFLDSEYPDTASG